MFPWKRPASRRWRAPPRAGTATRGAHRRLPRPPPPPPPGVFPPAGGGPRAPKRLSWGPVKVFNDLAMAAPLTRETQAGPRRPFLSTRLGVVALSVAVVLAGSVVLVAVKTSAPVGGGSEGAAGPRGYGRVPKVAGLAAAPLRLP